MEHPLIKFREEHHLSQDDIANLCGITRQIVLLTEQGIYSEIPPAIIRGIKDEYGQLATYNFAFEYHEWLIQEIDKVNIGPWIGFDMEQGGVPANTFIEWRNLISTSVSNFGKLIKIQPITIRKYESGATNNLPIQLVDRLKHWGFSDEYISAVASLPIGNGDTTK